MIDVNRIRSVFRSNINTLDYVVSQRKKIGSPIIVRWRYDNNKLPFNITCKTFADNIAKLLAEAGITVDIREFDAEYSPLPNSNKTWYYWAKITE